MKSCLAVFFILMCLVLQTGCASIRNAQAGSAGSRRTYQIHEGWVRQTTENTNLGFRKINRFKPVLYKSKSDGELIIQANSEDGIVAYRRSSGRLVWRLPILNGAEAGAALAGNFLFFGASDGQFYSLDADTGRVLWTFPARVETLSDPLYEDGVVYFLTGANSLYALEASTGKQLWLYSRPETSSLSIRGGSRPVIGQGLLYAGFSDGAIVALTVKTGQVKWEKQLNRNKRFRDMDTDPVLDGEFLYVLGYDDAAYALRAATGESVWKYDKGGYGSILMNNDRLYYAATTDELVCLDKTTGRQVWTKPSKDGFMTSPSYLKGILVYGESQGSLRFVESGTGREIGHFQPGRGIFSPILVDNRRNHVYFISNEGNLYQLEAKWASSPLIPYLR